MSCYTGSVRLEEGTEIQFYCDSIEECKSALENYISELPENERKFSWIMIETFLSGKRVAGGNYTDGKVCWDMYDWILKYPLNYDARDYMEVTDYGRFYE